MKSNRMGIAACASIACTLLLTGARHITPTVVMQKQADVIRAAVPDASQFFLRTVEIGRDDFQRIRADGGFAPEEREVKFFYGQDQGGRVDGIVLFPQVNNQHGPLEVGLAMNPDGSIRGVVVTKATVETKPWVQAALGTGLTARFAGMHAGDDPRTALAGVSKSDVGEMPYFMAQVVSSAVARGLVLYDVLYSE